MSGPAKREGEKVLAKLREICLAFPETSERLSHGADHLRAGEAVVPDGVDKSPRRRALRDLVRCSRRDAEDAREGRSGAVLRAAVRRPQGVAGRPARPWAGLERGSRYRRRRIRRDGSGPARRGRGSARPIALLILGGPRERIGGTLT